MVGNPGVYGKKRFERLDYAESIDETELATTAVDTDQLTDGAVTTAKLATASKTEQIYIQLGAAGTSVLLPKPSIDITLTEARLFASLGTATTGTPGSLTISLVEASSAFGTTTTLSADLTITGTTASLLLEDATTLTASIGATQAVLVVAGATTLVDDGAGGRISYTKD